MGSGESAWQGCIMERLQLQKADALLPYQLVCRRFLGSLVPARRDSCNNKPPPPPTCVPPPLPPFMPLLVYTHAPLLQILLSC